MSITNLLLIDSSITDYHIFVNSVNSSTIPIVYSSATTREEILVSLSEYTSIDRIGIAFSNSTNVLFLEGETFFNDPLEPFSNNTNFIIQIIQQFNVSHIDYLACSTLNLPEWFNYYTRITEQTGVVVGASDDNTGNILYGGDWVLESTGQDIEMIYFTQNIEYYTYLLDSNKSNFSVMMKQDNTIHFTGNSANENTQEGNTSLRKTLTKVSGIDGLTITQIAGGNDHAAILMNNGDVYMCGRNNTGACLFPDLISRGSFTKIPNATGLLPIAVECGSSTTYLLMNDVSGSIYSVGVNNLGQLGVGSTYSYTSTLQLMPNSSGKKPVSIKAGQDYLIITMSDNSLYGAGSNPRGQIGNGPNPTLTMREIILPVGRTPLQVSCGRDYSAALMADASGNKSVYSIGFNNFGQLGIDVSGGQYNTYQLMLMPPGLTPVSISCSVGNYYTLVLMNNGSVYGTGANNNGFLGIAPGNVTRQQRLQPMQMPAGLTATSISAGGGGPIVFMNNGTVYGCGENTYGQLGLGNYDNPKTTLELMPMPSGLSPTQIIAGFRMNFVQMNNSTLYAVGYNNQGQCGVGSFGPTNQGFSQIRPFNFVPIMVEYGTGHMVVLTTTGIYANGLNTNGQLGLGNTTTPVTTLSLMQNTTGLTPIAIACGASHTAVLMSDASGSIYGTGLNSNGQLGIATGNVTQQTTLAAGSKMQSVAGKTPKAINCGNSYTVVLMTDNTIYGTGLNSNGQLGIASGNMTQQTTLQLMQNVPTKTPFEVACGASHTVVLMTDGTIYGTGLNSNGQLGIATGNVTQQTVLQLMQAVPGKTPKDIACGTSHTIVLMTDGTIYGTGLNTNGQLGIATGNVTQQTTLQLMQAVAGKTPIAISGGTGTTFVLMSDGSLYGTGIQSSGQLGLGLGQETYQAQFTTLQEITTISSVRRLPSSNIYLNSPNIQMICFKRDSQILTDKGYIPIQYLRKGDLVKTVSNGYVPIHMLGKRDMYHVAATNRISDQLYVCTNDAYPEVFEPLVMTGCHSVLVKTFANDTERKRTIEVNGNTYVTDRHYRLPVCVDERAKVYDKRGIHTIYHISLENIDYYMNYGIYANGLLVETCSKRFLKELSNMEIL
jgi:alpha-tubulin suppressor-like RCC1 family protein